MMVAEIEQPARAGRADLGADGPMAADRPRVDAVYKRQVVARAVVTHPIDLLAHYSKIDREQHAAGLRLRDAIDGSWPAQRLSAQAQYVSGWGLGDDEPEEPTSEEEQHAAQLANFKDVQDAERHVSRAYWTTTRHVCAGGAVTSIAALASVQSGLRQLADHWRSGKKD